MAELPKESSPAGSLGFLIFFKKMIKLENRISWKKCLQLRESRTFNIKLWVIVLSLLVCGCAQKLIPIDRKEIVQLKNQAVIQVYYYPYLFKVYKMDLIGLISSDYLYQEILAESRGRKMVGDYSLDNPLSRVMDRFMSALADQLNLKIVSQGILASGDIDTTKGDFEKENTMTLDFETLDWRLLFFLTDWTHYRVIYSVRSRLIRLTDSKVVWQGLCVVKNQDTKYHRPTMKELVENNAKLLKAKLDEAADICAEQLSEQFFGKETMERGQPK